MPATPGRYALALGLALWPASAALAGAVPAGPALSRPHAVGAARSIAPLEWSQLQPLARERGGRSPLEGVASAQAWHERRAGASMDLELPAAPAAAPTRRSAAQRSAEMASRQASDEMGLSLLPAGHAGVAIGRTGAEALAILTGDRAARVIMGERGGSLDLSVDPTDPRALAKAMVLIGRSLREGPELTEASAVVPAPSTAGLALLGVLGVARRRRAG